MPSEDKPETDESNKIDHPYLQARSRKKEEYLNTQVPKDRPTAAKNMIRTDHKQQKLDLFINVSKTDESNHPEKSMNKIPSKCIPINLLLSEFMRYKHYKFLRLSND